MNNFFLSNYVKNGGKITRNELKSILIEHALKNDTNVTLTNKGALSVKSGKKTGRSPKDKYIVNNNLTKEIWWKSPYHKPMGKKLFEIQKRRAIDYLSTKSNLFVFDGYAGWDKKNRIKVRIICTSAYHAIFMENMLIKPTNKELKNFGHVDFTIYNAGEFSAFKKNKDDSDTCIAFNFESKEIIILGTRYAGEMKKGVFTVMNYLMPKKGFVSLHSSANEGKNGDVALFFGLSGTGKTTLSADSSRLLIGDDEHVWTDNGLFNIEGGCYAKCIDLSQDSEPEIYGAIKYGSIQENVLYYDNTRNVNYNDVSITKNTRCSYPLEFITNSKIPAISKHPKNVIFLTCDAFGILPPISKLSPKQATYHFISGYTCKIAGTEVGIKKPIPTFSACYGGPFLVWSPNVYAEILEKRIKKYKVNVWLVNTGWIGGPYGIGSRIKLSYTRAIINAIHDGTLIKEKFTKFPLFNFLVPKKCNGIPQNYLFPKNTWKNKKKYNVALKKLAQLFIENFKQFQLNNISQGGPKI